MNPSTNLEEYRHPDLYDFENQDFEPERSFILSIAREVNGPVLELGCGTGRMTIPLAQNHLDITGLDIVPEMLERAKEKARDLPIQWVEADVRDFHLEKQFAFIFEMGSVFMHMLTNADQVTFLARVIEHLSPSGYFLVSLLFPHPDLLKTIQEEQHWYSYQDGQRRMTNVSGTEVYDELNQIKTETAIRRIEETNGAVNILKAPLSLRYTFPQEMEALLNRSGFIVKERFGGPDRSPLSSDSRFMVYLCTKKDSFIP